MNYSPRERVAYLEGIKQGRVETEVTLSAEIDRLKAELDLRTKERDQATEEMEIKYDTIWIYNGSEWVLIGSKTKTPELFAHLARRGESDV